MPKPTARLTTPSQMVAALPLQLGYVPTESIVVVCCHEPRGRVGLTMRMDLPPEEHEQLLVSEIVARVRHQKATRVLMAIYTDEPGTVSEVRIGMVDGLRAAFSDLIVTEVVLVRHDRFWSYLCQREQCCPAAGRPVDDARGSASVQLLEAEQVLSGRVLLPDRKALERSLAGPSFLQEAVAKQRCEMAFALLDDAVLEAGCDVAARASLEGWASTLARYRNPPAQLGDMEAAALAVSLHDVHVRDQLVTTKGKDLDALMTLLVDVMTRTPPPYDAPICTLFAWMTYCQGGGSAVGIALERALTTDPDYSLALLLVQAMNNQVRPKELRRASQQSFLKAS